MSEGKSIGQVANHKPLREYDMEELAARQWAIKPSGGVLFARGKDRVHKDDARQLVQHLVTPAPDPDFRARRAEQPSLHILSMPGVHWRFERKILGKREGDWQRRMIVPEHTMITAVENDRAIYYVAAANMPGLQTVRSKAAILKPPPFAERVIKTRFAEFLFCNVDDLMQGTEKTFDVAWLDYTGPLTTERLKIIKNFYNSRVRDILIVTALKSRWNRRTTVEIAKFGSHSAWLKHHLCGDVLHDIEYSDKSPMAQFAVRHYPIRL